ncbi:hypothetical protein Lesp02_27510 [Lentzea sp. NBRC 105346]|uniref:MmpS family transport accessory protein n=1 Tax=Lentzea sp. NBRC 105346 TaxID=3032205 RepID=UPI002553AC70|nr:MmpS family transport accessory protein [Lentzea sp. NBRC 105346]GLZ30562.1 hypothetical protein Lesp02_27510 [Lentzea sp. NBRC 105346]
MTYQQPQYAPIHPPQQQPQPPQNGMGVAALVLGLLGLLFSFIPLVGVVAWPMVILGLVFGIVGLGKANKGRATNKGLAIAGIALSLCGLLVCIAWTVFFGAVASNVQEEAAREATVVYELSGDARDVTVTYTTFGDDTVAPPAQEAVAALPWQKDFKVKGLLKGGSVTATTGAEGGTLTCKVTVDGVVKKTETASGRFAMVSCTGF